MKKWIYVIMVCMMTAFAAAAQQSVEVKGVVKDEKGTKIENATVIVKDVVQAKEIPTKADNTGHTALL